MFFVAENALARCPNLKAVIIMTHAPRHDISVIDPTGLKPKLAQYANSTFSSLWHSSAMKDKITVGKHSLNVSEDMMMAIYKDERSGRYDGVHHFGAHAKQFYTQSVLNIFKTVLPAPRIKNPTFSSTHTDQNRHKKTNNQTKTKTPNQQSRRSFYNVPVNNQFDILGN